MGIASWGPGRYAEVEDEIIREISVVEERVDAALLPQVICVVSEILYTEVYEQSLVGSRCSSWLLGDERLAKARLLIELEWRREASARRFVGVL